MIWGWEIAVYLFLGGMAAGVMILTALAGDRLDRRAIFLAPAILALGMLALFLDLGSKLHVFRFYTAFRVTSPMSWGAWILVAIYPVTIAYGLVPLASRRLSGGVSPALPGRAAGTPPDQPARTPALQVATLALGVALGAYTGILLGTLAARALWSSLLLAPLFLVSGVSTGAALLMLFPLSHEQHALLRRWDVAAIAAELVLLGAFFAEVAVDGGARGRAAVHLFFGGPYTAPFFALVVVAGLAMPLAIELTEARRPLLRTTALAPLLLLGGGLALRWIFVLAGQGPV